MNQILYIILNGDLNMSSGKAAAQAVHAAMMLQNKHRNKFIANYRRTVIVLEARNREQLDGIADYLSDAGVVYEYYTDEGANEVPAFSFTALAVEPIDENDEERRNIFSPLYLYGRERWEDAKAEARAEPEEAVKEACDRACNMVAEKPKKKRWYETRKHYIRRCDRFYGIRSCD